MSHKGVTGGLTSLSCAVYKHVCTKFLGRHAEIFHLKSQNFILLVVLEEKSGDHQTQWTSSSRAHLYKFHLVAAIFQSGHKLRAKLSKAAKLTEQYRVSSLAASLRIHNLSWQNNNIHYLSTIFIHLCYKQGRRKNVLICEKKQDVPEKAKQRHVS